MKLRDLWLQLFICLYLQMVLPNQFVKELYLIYLKVDVYKLNISKCYTN